MKQLLETWMKFLKVEEILDERVFGVQAFVYHGSDIEPKILIPAFVEDEFVPGRGDVYGKGLYTVYELEGTATERGVYGPYIYKLKINLHGFIIYDYDVVTKVYGKPMSIWEQLDLLGEEDLKDKVVNARPSPREKLTSEVAMPDSEKLKGRVKGIVFTGKRDGQVAVVYDPAAVAPVAWKRKGTDQWNKVDKETLRKSLSRTADMAGSYSVGRFDISDPIAALEKVAKMPANKRIIRGELELDSEEITQLPDFLQILSNLTIYNTPLTSLPKGLRVKEDLFIRDTNITELPQDLEVGGNLYVRAGNTIASIPDGVKIGGNIYASKNLKKENVPQYLQDKLVYL